MENEPELKALAEKIKEVVPTLPDKMFGPVLDKLKGEYFHLVFGSFDDAWIAGTVQSTLAKVTPEPTLHDKALAWLDRVGMPLNEIKSPEKRIAVYEAALRKVQEVAPISHVERVERELAAKSGKLTGFDKLRMANAQAADANNNPFEPWKQRPVSTSELPAQPPGAAPLTAAQKLHHANVLRGPVAKAWREYTAVLAQSKTAKGAELDAVKAALPGMKRQLEIFGVRVE